MAKIYAVKAGRQTGTFTSWNDCEAQIKGFPGAKYKSFKSEDEANAWLNDAEPVAAEEKRADAPAFDHGQVAPRPGCACAYVDGSFHPDRPECYGAGVWYHSDTMDVKLSRLFTNASQAAMRNVAGEMEAAKLAVQLYLLDENHPEKLVIYHDYAGVGDWPEGNWEARKPETKEYAAWMREQMRAINIEFIKVSGHTGIKGNELADRLANEAFGQ